LITWGRDDEKIKEVKRIHDASELKKPSVMKEVLRPCSRWEEKAKLQLFSDPKAKVSKDNYDNL
jgi:hypothetical protein